MNEIQVPGRSETLKARKYYYFVQLYISLFRTTTFKFRENRKNHKFFPVFVILEKF